MQARRSARAGAKSRRLHLFDKLGRAEVEEATAGDIVALVGLADVEIGDTVSDLEHPPGTAATVEVDEPTLQMVFGVNTSPLAGRAGKYVTSRHLRDRLMSELEKNVALRVEPIPGTEMFAVSGRGLLHLGVLIETMRREGYELSIGKPHVITRQVNGITEEPFESLVVEVPHDKLGAGDGACRRPPRANGRNAQPRRVCPFAFSRSRPAG